MLNEHTSINSTKNPVTLTNLSPYERYVHFVLFSKFDLLNPKVTKVLSFILSNSSDELEFHGSRRDELSRSTGINYGTISPITKTLCDLKILTRKGRTLKITENIFQKSGWQNLQMNFENMEIQLF